MGDTAKKAIEKIAVESLLKVHEYRRRFENLKVKEENLKTDKAGLAYELMGQLAASEELLSVLGLSKNETLVLEGEGGQIFNIPSFEEIKRQVDELTKATPFNDTPER